MELRERRKMQDDALTRSHSNGEGTSSIEQWEEARRDLLRQLVNLRLAVVLFAGGVLAVLGYILFISVHTERSFYVDNSVVGSATIVSPVLAITAIVTILVIGVFRGFRDRDMDRSLLDTAARAGSTGVSR